MLLWVLIFNRGAWPRILTIALAALYFPMEKLIVSSPFFDIFDRLNFLTAISQLTVVLDQTIKQAAFRSAGLWGFSASEVSRLDLVYPQLMSINGLTYLTAMWGRVGLLVYGALVLTLLLAIGWLIVKDNSERRAMVVLPAWLLITADQYFGLIFYMAWQGYGLTNPPAFVGGFDITLQIFILAFIAFRRVGEGQSQNLKKKAELKLDKALAEDF
ncbi:MAG: hypothetical protein LBE31_04345 [Deltaproteobacteria bacterium]|nr:hypothetical protein [Deltaproteobacteria bacterium]